jgi:acetyl-CoA C-acetyltransferase
MGSRDGQRMGDWKMVDSMIVDGLWDVYHQYHMGITAENVAKAHGITREMQDALALSSQQKALAAQLAGKFKDEIVSVSIPQRKGDPIHFNTDEFINPKTNAEALGALRPAFDKAGSVTAGNASGINDGAAAVVVMSAKKAAALGLKPLARIAAFGTSGLDPATMGMGPVPASQKALARAGWKAQDVDLFELNEAFAAQACAVNKALDIDPAKVNVNGGAIAIGHPIGASGCRILVTLLHEMQRRGAVGIKHPREDRRRHDQPTGERGEAAQHTRTPGGERIRSHEYFPRAADTFSSGCGSKWHGRGKRDRSFPRWDGRARS